MESQLIDQTVIRFPAYQAEELAVEPLEKGGSDRKFYRMRVGPQQSLILAKYGNQREENRHYVEIAQFLHGLQVRVPEIFHHDETEGLIWMEDLGETDLWAFRNEPWSVRRALYGRALEQVLRLHTRAHRVEETALPRLQAEFNTELYLWEQNYFFEHCLGRHFGCVPEVLEERCNRARLAEIAEELASLPRVFVHRDFQSQNIVVKEGEACLIDFQGMRPGLAQYDLGSLIYDPYVVLSREEREELLAYYLERAAAFSPISVEEFRHVFWLCALQRLMQALGAYGFLGLVKGRADFLAHVPAAMANLREVVSEVAGLEDLSALLAEVDGRPSEAAAQH